MLSPVKVACPLPSLLTLVVPLSVPPPLSATVTAMPAVVTGLCAASRSWITGAGVSVARAATVAGAESSCNSTATPAGAAETLNVTTGNAPTVAVMLLVPAEPPVVQPPTVAMPLALVTWAAPAMAPPPAVIAKVTACP
jgi:hypothetical protein